ncbi:MAG: OmpA family protein [Proteobacteria bacterium]|nr:OmpA family protein [Pseudomonadota bacterium]
MAAAINDKGRAGSVAVFGYNGLQQVPRAALRVAVLLVAILLGACRTPPVKPVAVDRAAEQRAALNALGFASGDDGWLLNLPDPISFELEQDTLKPSMRESIATTAAGLLKANVHKLRIEGHTDNSGPRDYNVALSQRRAATVAREFIAHGFARGNVVDVGMGPDHPPYPNDTRENRAANRCVIIIVPADALAQ